MRVYVVVGAFLAACNGSGLSVPPGGDGGGADMSLPGGDMTNSACGVCNADSYCDVGPTCGVGGVCKQKPTACPALYAPVCGCDGMTYPSECDAHAAGRSVASNGACGKVCGGIVGALCAKDEFCDFADTSCGFNDSQGLCTTRPSICPGVGPQVCGCDYQTYGNECQAHAAGVDIQAMGPCMTPSDCRTAGCPSGKTCELCWANYACLPPGAVC